MPLYYRLWCTGRSKWSLAETPTSGDLKSGECFFCSHAAPNTHKSTYPQIIMWALLLGILSLGLCEAQTIRNRFYDLNAAHLIIGHSLSVMKLCHQKLWALLFMVFRRKIIVGFWRKLWAKFQTEAEKSCKVNFIFDKQENWEISTVSMGHLILISQRGWLRGWL